MTLYRRGGKASTTSVLQWMKACSLVKTGEEGCGDIQLFVRDYQEFIEPCPRRDDEPVSGSWVRITGLTTLRQISAAEWLIRKKMWLSSDKGKKPHIQKP